MIAWYFAIFGLLVLGGVLPMLGLHAFHSKGLAVSAVLSRGSFETLVHFIASAGTAVAFFFVVSWVWLPTKTTGKTSSGSNKARKITLGLIGVPIVVLAGISLLRQSRIQILDRVATLGVPEKGARQVLDFLEQRVHLVHRFEGLPRTMCPSQNRSDLQIQGAHPSDWNYFEVRSHYAPGHKEHRPNLVAPHSPRVDFAVWKLAQREKKMKKTPKWFKRLLYELCTGSEAVARMYVSPDAFDYWEKQNKTADLRNHRGRPCEVVRARLVQQVLVEDFFSNNWWEVRGAEVFSGADYEYDDLRLMVAPAEKGTIRTSPACSAFVLRGLPIVEVLLGVFAVLFIGKLVNVRGQDKDWAYWYETLLQGDDDDTDDDESSDDEEETDDDDEEDDESNDDEGDKKADGEKPNNNDKKDTASAANDKQEASTTGGMRRRRKR